MPSRLLISSKQRRVPIRQANSPAATRGARSRAAASTISGRCRPDLPSSGRAVRSPWPPRLHQVPPAYEQIGAPKAPDLDSTVAFASDRPQTRTRCRASARPARAGARAERAYQPEQGGAAGHDQAAGGAIRSIARAMARSNSSPAVSAPVPSGSANTSAARPRAASAAASASTVLRNRWSPAGWLSSHRAHALRADQSERASPGDAADHQQQRERRPTCVPPGHSASAAPGPPCRPQCHRELARTNMHGGHHRCRRRTEKPTPYILRIRIRTATAPPQFLNNHLTHHFPPHTTPPTLPHHTLTPFTPSSLHPPHIIFLQSPHRSHPRAAARPCCARPGSCRRRSCRWTCRGSAAPRPAAARRARSD